MAARRKGEGGTSEKGDKEGGKERKRKGGKKGEEDGQDEGEAEGVILLRHRELLTEAQEN